MTTATQCDWVITRGPRKDQLCGAKAIGVHEDGGSLPNSYCSRHKPKPQPTVLSDCLRLAKVSITHVKSASKTATKHVGSATKPVTTRREDGLYTVGDLIAALSAFDLNTPIYYSTDAEGNETCAVDFLPSAAKLKAYKRRFAEVCDKGEDGLPIVIIN